jgi:hypothetical protein
VNFGRAWLGLYKSSGGHPLWGTWQTMRANPSGPGGWFSFHTPYIACGSDHANGYFRAMDPMSGRWSVRIPVRYDCKTL